jgi:hypothetical protein
LKNIIDVQFKIDAERGYVAWLCVGIAALLQGWLLRISLVCLANVLQCVLAIFFV